MFAILFFAIALQAVAFSSSSNPLIRQPTLHQQITKGRTNNDLHTILKASSNEPLVVGGAQKVAYLDAGSRPPYTLSKQQFLYVVLTSIFVTCLIVADVIGVKLFEFKLPFPILGFSSVEHTCGMLTFPITFLLGDIINEYYGAKATRRTVYLGLAMSIFTFVVMNIAQALPYLDKPFNVTQVAFDMIFGSAKTMYIASITAYLLGSLADIWLFGVIKRLTKGKMLWLRATGSTIVSQLLDSFVVSYVAYRGGKIWTKQIPATMAEIWSISLTGYSLKFVIAGLITPILYMLRHLCVNQFQLEAEPVQV